MVEKFNHREDKLAGLPPDGFQVAEPEEIDERTRFAYDRFRARVNLTPDPVRGCLEWMGISDTFWNGNAWELASHFAYRQMDEDLKPFELVKSTCGNWRCVRLDHLVKA